MANEPSRSRRSLDIADLASQFDEVQSTLEGFMQKARRSNEDQIQSLSDALYEEIRSLQVAVDEVDFKTVEVLKSKQGPPGPAGKTHFPGKTDCCNLFSFARNFYTPAKSRPTASSTLFSWAEFLFSIAHAPACTVLAD